MNPRIDHALPQFPHQAKVTDCEKITSMELCANAPGCIYCLGIPTFFNRRILKSPLPNIDAGGSLPVPTTGSCTSGGATNQCEWFSAEAGAADNSGAHRSGISLTVLLLCFFFVVF